MQADRRDRIAETAERSRHNTQAIVLIAAAAILGGGAWLLGTGSRTDSEAPMEDTKLPEATTAPAAQPPSPQPADSVLEAPDIPQSSQPVTVIAENAPTALERMPSEAAEPQSAPSEAREPTVEEIDAQLREALLDAGVIDGAGLDSALNAPFLLDRGVSAIDQVARGLVPQRALNLPRPTGRFAVRRDGLQHYVDPAGYRRYDRLVAAITALSPTALAESFHRFRPLLSASYASLGYPADAVDNALIAALDGVLEAPQLDGPIELSSKGALWAFADPDLEKRSDLQKQLLRAGPDNVEALQGWARQLRRALLQ